MSASWAEQHRPAALAALDLTIGYGERTISQGLSVEVAERSFTVIIGPNACGKSTLLRALARVLPPRTGSVLLHDENLAGLRPREVAQRMGLLPQSALAPDGITVADLVARGRFPHQTLLRRWNAADEAAVARALQVTRTADLSERLVDELSGGQRQRVWVAMLLAQDVPVMLLDEPTTFLDIAHQYELLELLRDFHEAGRTLAAVLHDLNQAARYATDLVVMKDGAVVASGPPAAVIEPRLLNEVFGLDCLVVPDPVTETPMVIPRDPRRSG